MANTDETPLPSQPQRHKEFEDPHYHDDFEQEPPGEDGTPGPRKPAGRKPAKLPPPRRRWLED